MNERIIAIQADITTLDVDAIVNAANNSFWLWGRRGRSHPLGRRSGTP